MPLLKKWSINKTKSGKQPKKKSRNHPNLLKKKNHAHKKKEVKKKIPI